MRGNFKINEYSGNTLKDASILKDNEQSECTRGVEIQGECVEFALIRAATIALQIF